jgi:hypothetical protein
MKGPLQQKKGATLRRSSLYLRFAEGLRRRSQAGDLPAGALSTGFIHLTYDLYAAPMIRCSIPERTSC